MGHSIMDGVQDSIQMILDGFSAVSPIVSSLGEIFDEASSKNACFQTLLARSAEFQNYLEFPHLLTTAINTKQYDVAADVIHLWMTFRSEAIQSTPIENALDIEMSKLTNQLYSELFENVSTEESGSPLLHNSISTLFTLLNTKTDFCLSSSISEHREKFFFSKMIALESRTYAILCGLSTDLQAAANDYESLLFDALQLSESCTKGLLSDLQFLHSLSSPSPSPLSPLLSRLYANQMGCFSDWLFSLLELELPSQNGRPSYPIMQCLSVASLNALLKKHEETRLRIIQACPGVSEQVGASARWNSLVLQWLLRASSMVGEKMLRTLATDLKAFDWQESKEFAEHEAEMTKLTEEQKTLMRHCPFLVPFANSLVDLLSSLCLKNSSKSSFRTSPPPSSPPVLLPSMTASQLSLLLTNIVAKTGKLLLMSGREVCQSDPNLQKNVATVINVFQKEFLQVHLKRILEEHLEDYSESLLNTNSILRLMTAKTGSV
eukprot:GDKK01076425.1.p1 GENE.GDKK01076425.1~~GDKK01076425.1.p1  ORF type:complete len:492 (-),score=96.38 GDKK01076425.1:64-1539(-)